MSNLEKQNKDLYSFIKKVILKYFPYVEDRLYFFDDAKKVPQLDICINFNEDKTNIMFLVGTYTYKHSVPEKIEIDNYVEFSEIKKIIDFILDDHECISDMYINNGKLKLNFAINWSDRTIKGISCGDVELKLNFNDNDLLGNQYLYYIAQEYISYLEKTPSFNKLKKEYLDNFKLDYFNSLTKDEMLNLINNLTEEKLRQILIKMDNDLFTNIVGDVEKEDEPKNLILEKNKGNYR